MSSFMMDTSCQVPLVCAWHQHHPAALREFNRRLDAGETLAVAAPSLVETYSVLTRLPPAYRFSPAEARALIDTTLLQASAAVVALTVEDYRQLLDQAVNQGVAGGRIYDAVILACAVAARVDALLTFNERHFLPLAVPPLQVVVPA